MTMEDMDRIARVADVLDREAGSLTPDTRLDEIGWDSMGMLGVIALARQNGKAVTGAQVRGFATVGDVLKAVF